MSDVWNELGQSTERLMKSMGGGGNELAKPSAMTGMPSPESPKQEAPLSADDSERNLDRKEAPMGGGDLGSLKKSIFVFGGDGAAWQTPQGYGHSAAQPGSMMTQSRACGGCGVQYPAIYSSCPECGA